MKKKARDIKKGDTILLAGKKGIVQEVEMSDISKQGSKKCRLVVRLESGESATIIRPEEYPFDVV